MKILATRQAPSRPDRPATQLLHDEPQTRIVAFHLLPGQEVPPHRSTSTVVVQVTEGEGFFGGEEGESRLAAGDAAVFKPGEVHSIRAPQTPLRFLAILSPRPG